MNNGFKMSEKPRDFSFDVRVNFRAILPILSSSLWNNSREKIFPVLKKSSGHSRDIQAVSCEIWRWAALLSGRRTARFFWSSNRLQQNDCLLRGRARRQQRLYVLYFGRYQVVFSGWPLGSNGPSNPFPLFDFCFQLLLGRRETSTLSTQRHHSPNASLSHGTTGSHAKPTIQPDLYYINTTNH